MIVVEKIENDQYIKEIHLANHIAERKLVHRLNERNL